MNQLADHFWNFRGVLKVAKVVDLGTQMSLVRRSSGRFLLLDSYGVRDRDREALLALTDGGRAIEAVLNVHPFHTLHCRAVHEMLPHARLIGTSRHREEAPELPWEDGVIEEETTQAEFHEDLDFSIPAGVDFICRKSHVHTASVLVRHRSSGIVHVDDTISVFAAPGWLGRLLPQSKLKFHPRLAKALQSRPGAADEYAAWARDLADRWAGTPVVCAAHSAVRRLKPDGWRDEVMQALSDVDGTLSKHRKEYG